MVQDIQPSNFWVSFFHLTFLFSKKILPYGSPSFLWNQFHEGRKCCSWEHLVTCLMIAQDADVICLVRLGRISCSCDEGRQTQLWGSLQEQLFIADFHMFTGISPHTFNSKSWKCTFLRCTPQMLLHNGIQYVRNLNLLTFRIYSSLNELISHSDKQFPGSFFFPNISPVFSKLISIYVKMI